MGLFSMVDATEGEAFWDQFRRESLATMTNRELEQASAVSYLNRDAQFVLNERQFSKYADDLRSALDDRFESEVAKDLEKMEEALGAESELVEKVRSLKEQLTKEYTHAGLDIIYGRGDQQDLSRVRSILSSGFMSWSDSAIAYLQKFGEWTDIDPLVAALDQWKARRGLLDSDDNRFQTVARAISKLGRGRLAELVSLPMPGRLLSYLIVETPDKEFRSLGDSTLTTLFGSEHNDVRKAASLKCIRALPKGRLTQLLNDYVSADAYRYYNVIHWLDLGASTPRDRARSAAERVIAEGWLASAIA